MRRRGALPTAAEPLAGGFVAGAGGAPLFCRDWGEVGRPPVVFLASWSLPSDSWAYQMLALSEAGFRCVAYDRRGHGRSADPGRGYDFDTLADDLAAVLERLDLRGATLVRFSMGPGEIVRYLGRHGPGRVARVVLIGTTTPMLARAPDNPGGVDPAVFEAFREGELKRDLPTWVDANMVPFVTPETSPGIRDWVRGMALRASLKALLDCHRAITAADFRAELPAAVRVPALVVHGDRDATSPLDLTGRPTVALIPGARLAVYGGAPHGLFLTHADRLNADLLAFARGRP